MSALEELTAALRDATASVQALRASLAGVSHAAGKATSRLRGGQTVTFTPASFNVDLDIGGQTYAPINTVALGPNAMGTLNRPRVGGGVNVQAPRNIQARTNLRRIG